MKGNLFYKSVLSIIALLLLLNFFQGVPADTAEAMKEGETGRYQISSWAAQSGPYQHHSGYYIVDTATGKVIDSKSEIHTAKE